jgi:superfamily II DNA/RNA helicase
MPGMHNAQHSGLAHRTQWIQLETKRERTRNLVSRLLSQPENRLNNDSDDSYDDDDASVSSLMDKKVMIFLNTVDDVVGATQALSRAGIEVVSYHAKLSLEERRKNLERFRRYQSPTQIIIINNNNNNNNSKAVNVTNNDADQENDDVAKIMVCTDLASRGLDIPGVDVIVQLEFATNVVTHLHRMGRCGRAGQKTGGGIVYYSEKEIPLVQVVRDAEVQQEKMTLVGDVEEVPMDPIENQEILNANVESEGSNLNEPSSQRQQQHQVGKVNAAFSRKRGFTKKLKKLRHGDQEEK